MVRKGRNGAEGAAMYRDMGATDTDTGCVGSQGMMPSLSKYSTRVPGKIRGGGRGRGKRVMWWK